jgi:hypothetical protein
MAFMSYIFAATESDLDAAFPGWRRPLAVPVQHTFVNPFTKKVVTGYTTDPADVDPSIPKVVPGDEIDPDDDVEDEDFDDDEDAEVEEVDEATLRDAGLPMGFRKLQRVHLRDWFKWDTEEVLDIIAGGPKPKLTVVRFGTRHMIEAFPPEVVTVLAALTKRDLSALGTTLSDDSFFPSRGWSAETCARLLGELAAVATLAERPGYQLCFWMESP